MNTNAPSHTQPELEDVALDRRDQPASAIDIRRLTKRFGDVLAVDELSFTVPRGTVVGFLGPNGAGKTTTLRMLLGLVKPTSGIATINGRTYTELQDPLHRVGAVLEASSLHPGRSARNHLRVQALAAGVDGTRIDDVLELVELASAADQRVGGFSLGMRQRLGLAIALLADPEILILDEPANGLDPEGVRWLRELMRRLGDKGRTVLFSSHILAEVAQTVDSVVILNHGRLVTQAPLHELTAAARAAVRIRTPEPEALRDALAAADASAQITAPDRVAVTGTGSEKIGTLAARCGIPIFEISTDQVNLEEIFLELTETQPTREKI